MYQKVIKHHYTDFVCTVYQNDRFLVEAINIDLPTERTHFIIDKLGGMRGQILKKYIDQKL